MKTIIFFGTEKGFKRFEYENLDTQGITFKYCGRLNDCRGINFHGYILHYTATKDLRKEVNANFELLQHLIVRQINQ